MLCFGVVIVETGSNFNQLGRKQVSMCFYLDFTFSFKHSIEGESFQNRIHKQITTVKNKLGDEQ